MDLGNIQDKALNTIRVKKIPVTIILVNGVQLKGLIFSYDRFVIIVNVNGIFQMVYKHAVSTIIPDQKKFELELKERR